jgi:hypothetical protein
MLYRQQYASCVGQGPGGLPTVEGRSMLLTNAAAAPGTDDVSSGIGLLAERYALMRHGYG